MALIQLTAEQKEGMASGAKLAGAWGAVSATKLAELTAWVHLIAEVAAAIFTALLICEFLWKKVIRPIAEWRGWIKKGKKDADDE